MRVDLHCHTNCSDGELTPQQLLALAREREIDLLSITDHDTLAAYDGCLEDTAAKGAQNAIGPRIVKGIELSAVWRKSTVHVVGLNLDIEHPQLRAAVASQRNARAQRLSTILQRLKKQGVDISEQQVHDQCGHATPGRPHIAQLMVDLGYVSKVATAFDRYLGQGKVGDVKESWPALDTVVRWIVDSQGWQFWRIL